MTKQIDQVLAQAADSGAVPGVVAIAARNGEVIYEGAFGKRSLADPAPMTLDTMVRIASMTKAITSTAAMQLVERGKLSLDQPVAEIIPEFGDLGVLEGFDGDTPRLRPPRTQATIRNLATHTSGLTYEIWSENTAKYQEVTGTPGILSGQKKLLFTPLAFDPGTDWVYGIGIDWLGQVVEAVSGQTIDMYMQENLFSPLGMSETSFTPTEEQRSRMVAIHVRGEDGSLKATEIDWVRNPEIYNGGHGLYSTAGDYMKFLAMLANGGKADGTQVVKPETIKVMSTNQIGDLYMKVLKTANPMLSHDAEFFPGMPKKHSVGFQINLEEPPGMRAAGSLAWAGICNSFYWWDPTNNVTATILMQVLPFGDPKAMQVYTDFEKAVYAS